MSNRENREPVESLDLFLALKRAGTNQEHECVRRIIKGYSVDLFSLEHECVLRGGDWRIYKTVNARCPVKAMKWLMKHLIDHPEKASTIDTEWRTALLQPGCIFGEKKFMLDIDTKDTEKVNHLRHDLVIPFGALTTMIESPNGWHFITKKFDTREILKLDYVTLLRDGYYHVSEVKEAKHA